MNNWQQRLAAKLEQRRAQQRYRSRRVSLGAQGAELAVGELALLNFCSNDYLGLAASAEIGQALREASQEFATGSGASHLVCGHSAEHHSLEQELAEFTGRERALVFSSGYMANLGVITALLGKGDVVIQDKLNHASLIDGGLSCGAQFRRYRHADVDHLRMQLINASDRPVMIVTDGVFSMDGDIAPLPEIVELAEEFGALLMVDDAHGFGCYGEHGGGLAEHFSLNQAQLPILVGTFGKAFGTFGAFVAGSEALIENLIQFARSYIYTTALPPALAAATRKSLVIVHEGTILRRQLQENIAYFKNQCSMGGLPLMRSDSAIQPLLLKQDSKALQLSEFLLEHGIWVSAIRPPTVPEGSARLRITLSASHKQEQIERLVITLKAGMEMLK